MNDHTDDTDHSDLADRLDRAVAGLRTPDVLPQVLAVGRRRRAQRRVVQGVGGIAAASVLAIFAHAFADGRSPAAPSLAADPAAPTDASRSAGPAVGAASSTSPDQCPSGPERGWWSASHREVADRLAALLPDGVRLGTEERRSAGVAGLWSGDVLTNGTTDADFLQIELLPPPGTPAPLQSLQVVLDDLADPDGCPAEPNEPAQRIAPCEASAEPASCEEIRSEDGDLVGVATRSVQGTGSDPRATVVRATFAVPGGGYVQLYVSTGTPSDRPDTPVDPADTPAITPADAAAIVRDPAWTR